MRVEYFIKIVSRLVKEGCKPAKIAKELGISRTAVTTILGKNSNQDPPEDLKSRQLRGLVRLCKEYGIDPSTWSKLGKMIEDEIG